MRLMSFVFLFALVHEIPSTEGLTGLSLVKGAWFRDFTVSVFEVGRRVEARIEAGGNRGGNFGR